MVACAADSRAAVFKRIRAGCHTGAALWRQLSYVNDKADLCFASTRSLVARDYVEVLGRENGDPALDRTAAQLRAAETELSAKASSRARSAAQDRSDGLDDDLEL